MALIQPTMKQVGETKEHSVSGQQREVVLPAMVVDLTHRRCKTKTANFCGF